MLAILPYQTVRSATRLVFLLLSDIKISKCATFVKGNGLTSTSYEILLRKQKTVLSFQIITGYAIRLGYSNY